MVLLTIGKSNTLPKPRTQAYQPNLKRLKQIYRHHHDSNTNREGICHICTTKQSIKSQLEKLNSVLHLIPRNSHPDLLHTFIINSWHGIIMRHCGRLRNNQHNPKVRNPNEDPPWNTLPMNALLGKIARSIHPTIPIPESVTPALINHLLTVQHMTQSSSPELWRDLLPQHNSNEETYSLSRIDIEEVIKSAKLTQGINQENIPIELLKLNPSANGLTLKYLFKACLNTRTVPKKWNLGKLVPIYKGKGDKNEPGNYRPITLIATTRKIFELCILHKKFMSYDINPIQGGFQRSRGCLEQVARIQNFIHNYPPDKRRDLCIISLDIKGAYDSVNRNTLLNIISDGSPYRNLTDTLKSLYGPTRLELFINGTAVGTGTTNIGTQQGGPASPFLFNYYINPAALLLPMLPKIQSLNHPLVLIMLFADDIIYLGPEHIRQTFLNCMAEFAQRANLSFSARKCIYIGQGTTPDMNGSLFSARPSANYLGTIINLDGIHRTWQKTQIAKCYPLINNLSSKTPLNSLPLHRRATIYKAFIRSGHEYLIQLGSLLGNNQLALRNIYRHALEKI